MSFFGARDFLFEVAKGNVPGHELVTILSKKTTIPATEEDIWDVAGSLVYPTGAETLELISTGNDTSAGTGAREVTIVYLDTSFNEQTATVATNAGTQAITTTDFFRLQKSFVSDAGSLLENENDLTIQSTGGVNVRGRIIAGNNVSLASFYTVPAGKTAIAITVYVDSSKNDDAAVAIKSTTGSDGIFITLFPVSAYQGNSQVKLNGSQQIPEKSDIRAVGSSSGGSSDVSVDIQFIVMDNSEVNNA